MISGFRWIFDEYVRSAFSELRRAKSALTSYSEHQQERGDDYETEEFLRLNAAVNAAWEALKDSFPR